MRILIICDTWVNEYTSYTINFIIINSINEYYHFFLQKSKTPNIFPYYRVYWERLLFLNFTHIFLILLHGNMV
jgi:hypothetical protein